MEKKNPNTRSCASLMLEILLDALPNELGNQPTKIGLIFARYFQWSNQDGPEAAIATYWKKGTREFDQFLREYYEQRPEELRCDFRDHVLPYVNDCMFLAKQFCSIIRRSTRTKNAEKPQIPDSLDQFSPEQCSDFLADTLNFFMVHQDCVLRIGVAAPPPDYILGCRVPAPCEHFCGRDKEIKALHELLLGKGFAFVTSLPGMGKSELSRAYAHVHSQDYASYYQHTIYVTFYNSLRETICTIPFEEDEEIRQRYAKRRDLLLEALSKAPEPNSKWQAAGAAAGTGDPIPLQRPVYYPVSLPGVSQPGTDRDSGFQGLDGAGLRLFPKGQEVCKRNPGDGLPASWTYPFCGAFCPIAWNGGAEGFGSSEQAEKPGMGLR